MPVGQRNDPYRAYNFLIEIDGLTVGGFRECSGLDSTIDVVEHRNGNEGPTPRKLPGLVKFSDISLKYGTTDDTSLWDWQQKCAKGEIERKNGSIILNNEKGEEKIRWNFREGWPSKWAGPTFNASATEVAIESLEIKHEGVEKA